MKKTLTYVFIFKLLFINCLNAQTMNLSVKNTFFEKSDTSNKHHFKRLVMAGATAYVGSIALLNNVWYAQYPRSGFHFFNDSGEWLQMDKAGHVLSAYQESKWAYGAMRWTGMKDAKAAYLGMAVGMAFQGTLEVLDGFSTAWGFSWSDMAANTLGSSLFGIQQVVWHDQRIVLKVSNFPRQYSNTSILSIDESKTTTLRKRTNDIYGNNYTQTFFKDYNAITIWLSMNPKSFWQNSGLPDWLNIAVGYGADNMYGARANEWPAEKPDFRLSDAVFPRYRQFYLSLDVDLSRLKTHSKFIKALANTFNFIKIPAPTFEFNTLGQIKFHPIMF